MSADIVVSRDASLPVGLDDLLLASRGEGHNLVERLVREWNDASNRFDRPGEAVFEARISSRLVGVVGLNLDPYLDDPTVGRLRHLYVAPDARRIGVGRLLVVAALEHARATFQRVRLRTVQDGASDFYLGLGFEETRGEPDATHVFWL